MYTSYNYTLPIGSVFLQFVPLLIFFLLVNLVPSILSLCLAHRKGYRGAKFFWLGFFLGFFGFLYVGFMPEEPEQFAAKMRLALHEKPNDSQFQGEEKQQE